MQAMTCKSGLALALFSALFLFLTAKRDEAECLAHFIGNSSVSIM
jgi:hypothetical protein